MKRFLIIALMACMFVGRSWADEGMWLLPMVERLNIKDMRAKGLKLSAEDIYSVDKSSLKDAIVVFGAGCTGEIVSPDGLLFTNHHCGYSAIQALSSVEHDYLKYGFWAENRKQEIPAPGVSVKFVRHIEDVTAKAIQGVDESLTDLERHNAISRNLKTVIDEMRSQYPGMTIAAESMFGGNQYFLFVTEIYNDVRLVGTPPTSIGKFGGDTDNWMWPRHTGDFSIFRVYAAPDGKTPADYSPDNVPYNAGDAHLKISLKGYNEGDYSMIMGFPGRTQRFMTTYEIDQLLNYENPNRIFIRGQRQEVLRKFMDASDEIRIKYASKFASSSNYWKNSIGKSRGIRKLNVRGQKQAIEDRFTAWSTQNPEYKEALPLIEQAVAMRTKLMSKNQVISETLSGTEILVAASGLARPIAESKPDADVDYNAYLEQAAAFYKDYDETVDRACATVMLKILLDSVPQVLPESLEQYRNDIPGLVDHIYDNSVMVNYDKFAAYVKAGDFSTLAFDPALQLANGIRKIQLELHAAIREANPLFNRGHRLLIAGLMKMDPGKKYYPDANFTLRLTYGSVLPYSPADAVFYDYKTTLRGVMEKEDPLNPVEFTVSERLKELYAARDFGPYAVDGDVPTCFISNTDITGGNSGSPVLNANGHLIGIAFDGNWDAMSGDVAFEPVLQRTISVDVRYVLFVVDKFAGAGYLLDEMTIVK